MKDKKINDCSMCVFGSNIADYLGYSSINTYIPGCFNEKKKVTNPKKCNRFIQKGGARL